jgi:flagellar biosynthesis chaperone FliJ
MPPKKFVYRLQKILEFKEKKEEEEGKKLNALLQMEIQEKEKLALLKQKLLDTQATLRAKQANGTLNVEELRYYPGHIKNIEGQIKNQELRLQERQVYQKHKEKCREEWQAEIDMAEAIMLDELATLNFARNKAKFE